MAIGTAGELGAMTVADAVALGAHAAEIVPGDVSGGANTSRAASQRGMLELRQAGGVVDLGFRELLRPFDTKRQDQHDLAGIRNGGR